MKMNILEGNFGILKFSRRYRRPKTKSQRFFLMINLRHCIVRRSQNLKKSPACFSKSADLSKQEGDFCGLLRKAKL